MATLHIQRCWSFVTLWLCCHHRSGNHVSREGHRTISNVRSSIICSTNMKFPLLKKKALFYNSKPMSIWKQKDPCIPYRSQIPFEYRNAYILHSGVPKGAMRGPDLHYSKICSSRYVQKIAKFFKTGDSRQLW